MRDVVTENAPASIASTDERSHGGDLLRRRGRAVVAVGHARALEPLRAVPGWPRRRSNAVAPARRDTRGRTPSPTATPVLEGGTGDVLHPRHQVEQPLATGLARDRGEADPAVAGEHGGHPVGAGGLEQVVPEHLAVVMRVDVHEAGRHQKPRGVDDLGGSSRGKPRSYGNDPPIDHRDIRGSLGPRPSRRRHARYR